MLSVGVPLPPTVKPPQAVAARPSRPTSCTLVMGTVAEAGVVGSTSVAVTPGSATAAGPFSKKAVVPAVVVTTGALWTAVTVTVLLAVLLGSAPSLATKEITRAVVPGSRSVLLYVTDCRQAW